MLFNQVLLESNHMRSATKAKESGMHTRSSILKTLADHREEVRRFGVRSLGLFGSVARGQATAASDLDFIVDLETPTFDAYMGLMEFLEELFQRPVDLVLANTLKPRLREPILRDTVHAPGL
jgi:predicted nucleotidyltransferase